MSERIIRKIVQATYIRNELEKGYTGKFVIHDHYASHHHWDLRKSLDEYSQKRPGSGNEPKSNYPDKPGTVYRSWAIPKHRMPTSSPVLATETEDHDIAYGKFHGMIPEGEYGAGKVKIHDHGTFRLVDVEYDKKYVFYLKGTKIKGYYVLVKTDGKNFIFNKVKNISDSEKKASQIDCPRKTLNPLIWNDGPSPEIRSSVRFQIINSLVNILRNNGFSNPWEWIVGIKIVGSQTTNQYHNKSDIDINIETDYDILRQTNAKMNFISNMDTRQYLRRIIYKLNDKPISGTTIPMKYFVIGKGHVLESDAIYDLLEERWIKNPVLIPADFNPDHVFRIERMTALSMIGHYNNLVGEASILVKDLEHLDSCKSSPYYTQKRRILHEKAVIIMNEIKNEQKKLKEIRQKRFKEKESVYPSYHLSKNWTSGNIIFKYVQLYGYDRIMDILSRMTGYKIEKIQTVIR
jgi:hypothetical protein